MMEFDKEVPIPTSVERVGVNIELLRAMEVGDSKWWSEEDAGKAARFYRVAKKLGIKVLIRKVGKADPRGAGTRMWRLEGGPAAVAPADPLAAAAAAATRAVKPKRVVKVAKKAAKIPRTDSGLMPAKAKAKKDNAEAKPKRKRLIPGIPSTPAALKRAAAEQ